jgi:hypothetical protein
MRSLASRRNHSPSFVCVFGAEIDRKLDKTIDNLDQQSLRSEPQACSVVGTYPPHATFGNNGANVGEIIPKQVEFSSG